MNPLTLQNIINSINFVSIIGIGVLFTILILILIKDTSRQQVTRRQLRELDVLKNSFQLAPIPLVVIDGQAKILRINDQAAKLFNKPAEELFYSTLEPFLLVASSESKQKQMSKDVEMEKPYVFEARIPQQKDNMTYDFSVTGLSTVRDPLYLVAIEPAEQKKRENEQKELLEIRINEVESTTGIGFFVYDFDTAETIWSRGLYEMLEVPLNTRKPSLDFFSQFSKENREDIEQLLMDLKNQKPYTRRLKLDTYKNSKKIVDLTLRHHSGSTHRHQRSLGVLRDVTELEKMRLANDTLTKGSKILTELGGIYYVLTDKDDNILRVGDYTLKDMNLDRHNCKKPFSEIFGEPEFSSDGYITERNGHKIFWQEFDDPDPDLAYVHRIGTRL